MNYFGADVIDTVGAMKDNGTWTITYAEQYSDGLRTWWESKVGPTFDSREHAKEWWREASEHLSHAEKSTARYHEGGE